MNTWHTFESLLAELPAAQSALADNVRALVYQADPASFERLDFDDDRTFLEPTVFAYFTAADPPATLAQLLFSYMPAARKPRRLRAYADTTGLIHLPGMGWITADAPGAFCELQWDGDTGRFLTGDGGDALPLSRPDVVDESGIVVSRTVDPLLQRFLTHGRSTRECGVPPPDDQAHVSALARAFRLMRRATPALFDALCTVTRHIVLFSADRPNSSASLSAHGAVFLNVKDGVDEIFFVDDLAHQCGHTMFNALTQEKDRFLVRPASTPLRDICGDEHDPRTLYSAFHGLFTYSTILRILTACESSEHCSVRQRHEALGRIAFNLNKFASDLDSLAAPGLFTTDGRALYLLFNGVYDAVDRAYRAAVRDLDLSDQPYVFDYARFAARHPAVRDRHAPAVSAAWSRR